MEVWIGGIVDYIIRMSNNMQFTHELIYFASKYENRTSPLWERGLLTTVQL